jgi:OFA family oxalate/formate antiporter-like MFS transporter
MRGKRLRVMIGAVVIQLILGTVYGYSIFWQPIDSELGLSVDHANYAFAICILSFAVTMVIAGRVQDVKGPRFPAIVGGVLMGAGFLLASLVTQPFIFYLAHSAFTGAVGIVLLMIFHALVGQDETRQSPILAYVPMGIIAAVVTAGVLLGNQYVGRLGDTDQLFLLWGTVGFLAGAGIGFAYVCPIAALVKWFPNHKGLVSGVAVAGFGFGAYIFAHKQIPFSAENYIKNHGIIELFQIHGVVSLIVVVLAAMMLSNPPGTPSRQPGQTNDSNWQETLRRPAFYVLWLMFFSGAMAGLMVIGILKPFAGSQLVEAATAGGQALAQDQRAALLAEGVAAVGWLAIFNAVGRVVWGLVSDHIGRTLAFAAMFLLQAIMMFLLIQMQSTVSLAVAASIIGFNFGGNFALFPSATADLFGAKNLGVNYGCLFTSYGIAGVVGIAAGNAAKEATGDYGAAFLLAAALCLLSAGLAIGLQFSTRRHHRIDRA